MPAEPVSHTILWLFMPALTTIIAAAQMTPNTADAWTAAGAMLGSFIAVMESNSKRRGWAQTATLLVASSVCGVLLPGAAAEYALAPETKDRITWQMWALAGFVSALPGWGVVIGILRWTKQVPATVEQRLNLLTNTPAPQDEDRNPEP